jgi:hypothetical protein
MIRMGLPGRVMVGAGLAPALATMIRMYRLALACAPIRLQVTFATAINLSEPACLQLLSLCQGSFLACLSSVEYL